MSLNNGLNNGYYEEPRELKKRRWIEYQATNQIQNGTDIISAVQNAAEAFELIEKLSKEGGEA